MTPESMNFSNTAKLFDPAHAGPVTVIGVGSVGSWVVELFARIGAHDITVYDFDGVEPQNIPASAYRQQCDLGRAKVDALQESIFEKTGCRIKAHDAMFDGTTRLRGTVVACIDKMDHNPEEKAYGRKCVFERVQRDFMHVDLYLDSRIHMQYAEVYAVDPKNETECGWYTQTLFDDATALRQHCGEHSDCLTAINAARVIVTKAASWWAWHDKGKWIYAEYCGTLFRVF